MPIDEREKREKRREKNLLKQEKEKKEGERGNVQGSDCERDNDNTRMRIYFIGVFYFHKYHVTY
jgi:hypothetical protein